ncbi:ATP-NAD kinase-like domain-containing protein [Mortierella sp. GBAus27b]|nr:ATP-NAD kinase-like domain-containing protein [Mortierella sp. GBAus27b]
MSSSAHQDIRSKKIGFVVNRRGGGGKGGKTWDSIEATIADRLSEAKWKVEYTQHSGHASDLAREFVEAGYQIIVAVGGDGTISQVVHGYMLAGGNAKGCSIGIISTGTGGDFVRTTRTPKDPIDAFDVILNNTPTLVDVGHITCAKTEQPSVKVEQHFINVCSVGISGAIVKRVESSSLAKLLSGRLIYWIYTYLTGFFYVAPRVKYTLSEGTADAERTKEEQVDLYIMAAANGRYIGGNMNVAPQADLSDGKFDVVCLHNLSLYDAVTKAGPALKTGSLMNLPSHQAFTERNGRISMSPIKATDKVYVEADGEVAGILPATWQIIPNGCRLILP